MKKIFFLAAILSMGLAQAAEVTVLDRVMPGLTRLDSVKSKFSVDLERASASVNLLVKSVVSISYPGGIDIATTVTNLEVPELELMDNELIVNTSEGPVTCGTMGHTRVMKRPLLKLNGKCGLITTVSRTAEGRRVQVKIVTE